MPTTFLKFSKRLLRIACCPSGRPHTTVQCPVSQNDASKSIRMIQAALDMLSSVIHVGKGQFARSSPDSLSSPYRRRIFFVKIIMIIMRTLWSSMVMQKVSRQQETIVAFLDFAVYHLLMYMMMVRPRLLWLSEIRILFLEEFVECSGPDLLSQADVARELREGFGHPVALPTTG